MYCMAKWAKDISCPLIWAEEILRTLSGYNFTISKVYRLKILNIEYLVDISSTVYELDF